MDPRTGLAPAVVRRRVTLALAWYSVGAHRGVTRFAHEAGWILDGGFLRGDMAPQRWRGDGIIGIFGMTAAMDDALNRATIPLVNIGYSNHNPRIPSVAADSNAISRLAADHFLSRGFRHFAYFQQKQSPGESQRYHAFRDALLEHGHSVTLLGPMEEQLIKRGESHDDRNALHHFLGEALSALPKPVAVFSEYDDRAITALDAALSHGLKVPEQVAVLGVDNDELRCPFSAVPLSSIDSDEELIGYTAASLLQKLMNGESPPTEPVLVPPKGVVVRQSTNILAIPHEYVAMALRLIWENYIRNIGVADIANEVPMSYPQLHASFVKYVGHSIGEELTRRRVEHAQRLLSDPEIKAHEVARQSGFTSADHMSRVFNRRLGISVSEYRKQFALRRVPGERSAEAGVAPASLPPPPTESDR